MRYGLVETNSFHLSKSICPKKLTDMLVVIKSISYYCLVKQA